MKGFKKDGKFIPTGNKSKSSLKKSDVRKKRTVEKPNAETMKEFDIKFIVTDENNNKIDIPIPSELKAELSDRLFEELVDQTSSRDKQSLDTENKVAIQLAKQLNDQNATLEMDFISDAGHGWLKVPLNFLKPLGIDKEISGSSYKDGKHAYLEEDVDASLILDIFKKNNVPYSIKEINVEEYSPIRDYRSYKQ